MTCQQLEEQLWEHRVSMLRLAWSILRHAQNAEDAVSAAILQAYSRADSLRDEASFKPWLMRITVNCCYDLIRKEKRERALMENVDPSALFTCERQDTLLEIIGQLPPEIAQVLVLYYYENFSTAEIARALKVAGSTVRVRLLRGRRRLRELMEEENE